MPDGDQKPGDPFGKGALRLGVFARLGVLPAAHGTLEGQIVDETG